MNKIIAVIVTFNGLTWIEKCLVNLHKSSTPIIPVVIDNQSTDGTAKIVKEKYPNIKLIENITNLGFGKANNIGLKYALEKDADYVLLLNQDVYLQNDTVKELIDLHEQVPQFGIISPVHLNGKGKELDKNFSACIPFKSIDEITQYITSTRGYVGTHFVNAATWLLTKRCINDVGGFDPLFEHYGEDRDYCYRATYKGYKIGVKLQSTIWHDRIYSNDNKYRNLKNRIFTVGLAHIKNINKPLYSTIISWLIIRIIVIIKSLAKLDLKTLKAEAEVIFKIFVMLIPIMKSREISKTCKRAFIEL